MTSPYINSPYQPGQQINPNGNQQDPYLALLNAQPNEQALASQMDQAQALRAQPLKTNAMAGRVVQKVTPFAAMANTAQNVIAQTQIQKAMAAQMKAADLHRSAIGTIISQEEARQNAATDPSKNHPDTNAKLMSQDPQFQFDSTKDGVGGSAGALGMDPSIPGQ